MTTILEDCNALPIDRRLAVVRDALKGGWEDKGAELSEEEATILQVMTDAVVALKEHVATETPSRPTIDSKKGCDHCWDVIEPGLVERCIYCGRSFDSLRAATNGSMTATKPI